eukprot:COSAG01_NODE_4239_length_5213_cov_3.152914_6_plen_199_part_00
MHGREERESLGFRVQVSTLLAVQLPPPPKQSNVVPRSPGRRPSRDIQRTVLLRLHGRGLFAYLCQCARPPPPPPPVFLCVHLLFLLRRSRKTNRGLQELIREGGCRVKQVGRGHKRGRPASLTPLRACALVLPVRPSLARLSSDLGAAYGTAKSGVGVASMGVLKPELVMRSIIPVVMAGVIGIYGLIVSVIIVGASA